ncbi:hypothetical protein AB0G67_29200 [Streptomyces sp. NPDC021056]|uniref:hypothetical protein n=1 Tax=Streptomyces sp. NPDC021056 TaxID=3155012 RepID=UPI0033FB0FEF
MGATLVLLASLGVELRAMVKTFADALMSAEADALCNAEYRQVGIRHGQKHYSGTYWSSMMRERAVYEARLEPPPRLLHVDFDQEVTTALASRSCVSGRVTRRGSR